MFRLCLLLLLLVPCSASGGSALPADRPLRVVMDNTYPPYVFLDSRGVPQGILPDQWRLWQERTGVRVEITALDWHDALAAMRAGQYEKTTPSATETMKGTANPVTPMLISIADFF